MRSNLRSLLVCTLLIITMVPVLLSTLPNFQALAACGNHGSIKNIGALAIGIASCGGGGHQGPGWHNGNGSGNNNNNNSTTTSVSSP